MNPMQKADFEALKDIEKSKDPQLSKIEKEYASILVNEMLNTGDAMSVLSARSRLKFYDSKLRQVGLRATIKVGTEKIEN